MEGGSAEPPESTSDGDVGIDLYWIPLGAGASVVKLNGKAYEGIKAFFEHRSRTALYHSALAIRVPEGRYVVEVTPVPDPNGGERGVVGEGPVGLRLLGRFRLFRYEIRRWLRGTIPDVGFAVESPVRITDDVATARRVLDLLPSVPTLVWGRDEAKTGDMWNSNSVVAWALLRTGLNVERLHPPSGGRAPGWDAGIVVGRREREEFPRSP
jgi:hypothetical protein